MKHQFFIFYFLFSSLFLFCQTVTIGTQVWTSKNLDVSKFRNGDAIPLAKTNAEWELAGQNYQPAWCYYENNGENGTKYGKLYNWYAVNDPRGLAPAGFHIPSDAEWTLLTDYLGGETAAGTKMKSSFGWDENCNGSNSSGFAGLPGGCRHYNGAFGNIGRYGIWWSATAVDSNYAWLRYLDYDYGVVDGDGNSNHDSYSVRCLGD